MPKSSYNSIKANMVSDTVVLNHLELLHLRLCVHGLSNKEIAKFLEIDRIKLSQVRKSIFLKYGTKNWVEIISKALQDNILFKLDYIDLIVKDLALKHTQIIFENVIESDYLGLSIEQLKQKLLTFYYMCELKLNDEYDRKCSKEKLTEEEKMLLKFKYNNASLKVIYSTLKIKDSSEKLVKLEKSLLKKLKANNWYNAFKKAFQFKLLDFPRSHSEKVEIEAKTSSLKILRIINLKRLSNTEKKLSVYNELLELYANIEFSKLIGAFY